MAETSDPEPEARTRCVACKEWIMAGARVCTRCKSSQSWTRHIVGAATLAGAVVGVLSIFGAAASLGGAWQTLQKLVPAPAKLAVPVLTCESELITLRVGNLGDKPALLQSVHLRLKLDGTLQEPVTLTAVAGEEIVEPHKIAPITYKHQVSGANVALLPTLIGITSCHYLITIETATIDGPGTPVDISCACPDR